MAFRETEYDGVEWIHLALHVDQWRALANMEINIRVP